MAGRFSVEAIFKAVDRITAPVSRMQNRVGKFSRSMRSSMDSLNRSVDRVSGGVKKAALAITLALGASSAAMGNVISTGATFEQTIVAAAAKFPGEIRRGTAAFEQLEKVARKTGATTEFTASQSAEAINFLAMAGFNAEQSIAALPGVVDLATAAQVDLGTAADVASDSLGSFNLMTKDTIQLGRNLARVNDVIARTTTSANTTVETLFETIKDGAPVATSAGASLETFAALAGELANAGIKGTRAGTTLKNMFLSLSAPGSQAAKILRRLKIQTADADGNLRDVVDILGDLNKSLVGLGTAERAAVLEGIFGKIPIAGVNVLLAAGSEKLKDYRRQLEGATGASSTMASVMRDTVQGRINSLNSAIEGVKITIFSMNRGPLTEVLEKMTDWVRANEQLIATRIADFLAMIFNNLGTIATWIERIGIALAVFFTFVTVLKTLVLVMTAFNLVMAMNPIGLVVLAVMALIAAGAALVAAWDPIKGFFADMWDGVVQIFQNKINQILGVVDRLKNIAGFVSDVAVNTGSKVASFFGFGDEEEASKGTLSPSIVSPQERTARSIEERRTTSAAEVTIRDETGRAQVTGGKLGPGLQLQNSGAF